MSGTKTVKFTYDFENFRIIYENESTFKLTS